MLETVLLTLGACFSAILGTVVLIRNPMKPTHRLFAAMAGCSVLWALGVAVIIHCKTESTAIFWIRSTFIVTGFFPAIVYHFASIFPHQKFEGYRSLAAAFYATAGVIILGSFTPYYLRSVSVSPTAPPQVEYGPVFTFFSVMVVVSLLVSSWNLYRKQRQARGVERRQIEHMLLGIFLCMSFSILTNVLAPAFQIRNLEVYGPIFTLLLMSVVAYAMIRYHLLDIWVLVSRTTIYAAVTTFVFATFLGTISLVQFLFSTRTTPGIVVTTLLAALVIALVLQPLKERLQLLVDRTILKRRYDVNALCAKITQHAAQFMPLHQLLDMVARDIRVTIGSAQVRVWVVDENDPSKITMEYSSVPEDDPAETHGQAALLQYMRTHPDPLVLKKLLHERPTDHRMRIAQHLAELDAYVCLPLRASSRVVGVLALAEKTSGDIYSADDLVVFTTIASPLGTAIENARLYLKLEQVNLHLERILSSMRGGVVAVDDHGRITTINAAAIQMLGPIEVGQYLDKLQEEVAGVLRQTLLDGRGVGEFETVITGPEQEKVPVVISSSCLEMAGGVSYGALAMINDLTQLKRLEQNVQRADRLSSIGTLAAGMAHEVKNPLVSIKTFTQLLLGRFEDADFRKTFAEVVPHEVERIDMIVSRLLDFARPRPVCFAPHDLRKIIEHVLMLVENHIRKEHIEVRTEFPSRDIPVYGDEQQLHQVFLNLFLNALDALKEARGGELTVRAYYDRIHLRHRGIAPFLETECIRVAVTDTGCGIPVEHMEQLFTPFFTTKIEGCGLGLSVVHGIVMEHGGEIDVQSAPGAGTSFTVTLPLMNSGISLSNAQGEMGS
ncbi:MAG TPA: ATP-binding protein [Candidatus Bathyarchaeia archaeon]|nr:ATP-binding protein [Candidatus Bathyarchaeia archaeon]